MRIRKRFPPSSSSLSPSAAAAALSVSDPQPSRSPVLQPNSHENLSVVVVQEAAKTHRPTKPDPPNQPFRQPRSQEMMIGSANPRWGFLNNIGRREEMKEKEKNEDEGWKAEQEKNSNDAGIESIGAELNMMMSVHLSQTPSASASASASASTVVGRWCEEDKLVLPLKKRKGSFDSTTIAREETNSIGKEKMKSKTNKKCSLQNGDHGKEGMEETDQKEFIINGKNDGVKKSKRGSVIMEGSRCSRVNGRGWRCCQPTLVGYSLCEHHLGKGRLRSMSSVRNRGMAANQIGARDQKNDHHQVALQPTTLPEKQETRNDASDHVEEDNEKKKSALAVVAKKRVKLGVVKARSISSLLGQTNTTISTIVAANGDRNGGVAKL